MTNVQNNTHATHKVDKFISSSPKIDDCKDCEANPTSPHSQPVKRPCRHYCQRKYDRVYHSMSCRCVAATVARAPPFQSVGEQQLCSARRSQRRGEVCQTPTEPQAPASPANSCQFGENGIVSEQSTAFHGSERLDSSQHSSVCSSATLRNGYAAPSVRSHFQQINSGERPTPGTTEKLSTFVNSSKSAPQLFGKHCVDNLQPGYDALLQFHSRYYNKLCEYMAFVLGKFPLPVAISFRKPRSNSQHSTRNSDGAVATTTVWLDRCFVQTDFKNARHLFRHNLQKGNGQRSTEIRLILHFACSRGNHFCLYPGRSCMSCFDVETKNAVLWMQLLVLSAQVQFRHPLASDHPLMQTLRQSWISLLAGHLGGCEASGQWTSSASQNQVSAGTTTGGRKQQRAASMNLDTGSGCQPAMSASVSSQGEVLRKRARSWHLLRLRPSHRQLRKVNSFFLLATRAYPKVVDLLLLERELRKHHVFEVFRLDSPGEYGKSEDQWNCLYCTKRPSNVIRRASRRLHAGDTASQTYKMQTSNPENTPSPVTISACKLSHKGVLLVRHIPAGSRRISLWTARWRLQEFRLQHGFLEWRRPPTQANRSGPPQSGSDAEEENCCNCTSNRPLKISSYKKIQREGDCIQIPIASVTNVCGVRHKRTGILEQLEINTDACDKWLMKPVDCQRSRFRQTPVCNSVNRLTSPEPDSQSETGNDQLTVWMQFLQIALARANQVTEWQSHT